MNRTVALLLALTVLSLLAMALGASVGSTGFDSLLQARDDPMAARIVLDIRLPRTVAAWLAGALLGLAGAVAQGLFRNPLADPFLLGSASGAALAVAFVFAVLGVGGMTSGGRPNVAFLQMASPWVSYLGLTGAAFLGALGGVLLALLLARGVQRTLRLLLAGVIVGFVLGAIRELLQLANPDILQAMQGFTLGITGFVGWRGNAMMTVVLLPMLVLSLMLSRVLDALSLGESTALSLGVALAPARVLLVGVLSLATGAAVAQTGLIGFVGLVAPHLARSLGRSTHGPLLLLATLVGGLLLLLADIVSRVIIAPRELPVGVLTAMLGGSYLLWLMYRQAPDEAAF